MIDMKFLDRWLYKLAGKKMPVIQVTDVDNGKIKSITISKWVKRPNSLLETWHVQGAEITTEGLIQFTDESGLTQPAYTEYSGRTADLFVVKPSGPNVERVIGAGAMLDDIAEAMDLNKSMRQLVIGVLIGICLGWLIIGPMINQVLS